MLSYWASEMQKIKSFKVFNRIAEEDGQPLSIIGFTQTDDGVDLHILKASKHSREPVFMDRDKPQTHRNQMNWGMKQNEEAPIWARTVLFGDREIMVKSAHGNAVDMGQIKATWILAEALRQGWKWQGFDETSLSALSITTMTLGLDWIELEPLINDVTSIKFERDDDHKAFLVELALELPIQQTFDEPLVVSISKISPECDQTIVLHGIELRDVWLDFEEIYECHRLNNTFPAEALAQFKLENERNFENFCPRGMRFAVVTYEAEPQFSLECHTAAYLDSVVDYSQTVAVSAMSIMIKSSGEVGSRGLPLRTCVIHQPLSADTEMLKFEIFKLHQRIPLGELTFTV